MNLRHFGAKPTADNIGRYEQSPNWNGGHFHNLQDTSMDLSPLKIPEIIYKQIKGRSERMPDKPLEVIPFDGSAFIEEGSESARFIWYGHSALMMRMNNKTLFIDPMLGPDASPIGPIRTKRFSNDTLDIIDDLPQIDLVLLTHDHYDHIDLASIEKLKSKVSQWYVALGVKRHLVKWGIDQEIIIEFDWWDQRRFEGIQITLTPTRHFSGRGLNDRAKSLWGGWSFRTSTENIWFSGDSGYGSHFSEIGAKLGPFDFAFMECGQYNENWAQIHMFPEESVQAAVDAGVQKAMPVHWGAFTLAPHHWTDPINRFNQASGEVKLPISIPRLGQVFDKSSRFSNEWWNDL